MFIFARSNIKWISMLVGGMMLATAAWSSHASAQTPKSVSSPVAVPTATPPGSGPASGPSSAAGQPSTGAAAAAPAPAATTPAATTPAAPRIPTPAVSAYAINPGDELEIFVWGEERLQRVLRVLPDGTIAFPLVGQLLVQGRFPQNVEQMVSERLRPQYRGEVPFVTVSVKNPAGMQFSVMGRVRSPGSYTAGRYVNLLDALSLAGGPAEFANLDGVLIIRNQNGHLTTSKARLGSIFKGGGDPGDVERAGVIRIEPGDVVIVP